MMMENLKFLLYFLIGGFILALVAYMGSKDRGLVASFITSAPLMTILSIVLIYHESGGKCAQEYITGLIYLTPAWTIYLVSMIYFLTNFGLITSIILGIIMYLSIAVSIMIVVAG